MFLAKKLNSFAPEQLFNIPIYKTKNSINSIKSSLKLVVYAQVNSTLHKDYGRKYGIGINCT